MNITCMLPVRLESTRLSSKHLREVRGRSLLEWLIARQLHFFTHHNETAPDFVVASYHSKANLALAPVCEKTGVALAFGNPGNIPRRFLEIAEQRGSDAVVCIDGDDIACSPAAVASVISALSSGRQYASSVGLPLGMNATGFHRSLLAECLETKQKRLETGWTRIFPGYVQHNIPVEAGCACPGNLRFTLDYDEDLSFFTALIEGMGEGFVNSEDKDLISFVLEHKLYALTDGVHSAYWKNFEEKKQTEDNVIG